MVEKKPTRSEENLKFMCEALFDAKEIKMDWDKTMTEGEFKRSDTALRKFQEILKEHDYKYHPATSKVVKLSDSDAPARTVARKRQAKAAKEKKESEKAATEKEESEKAATEKRKLDDVVGEDEVTEAGGKKTKRVDATAEVGVINDGEDGENGEAAHEAEAVNAGGDGEKGEAATKV